MIQTETEKESKHLKKNKDIFVAPSEEEIIFNALDKKLEGFIPKNLIEKSLDSLGLKKSDPRLKSFFNYLEDLKENNISLEEFKIAYKPASDILGKAFRDDLVIPNFEVFTNKIIEIFNETKNVTSGKVADYIPQLKKVAPENYGVSICSIDGQQLSVGDCNKFFSIQSTCKPLNYCLALEQWGRDKVHTHVGREPSGHSFNEITLDSKKRPHNPLINAGAIMSASMVKPELGPAERFSYVLESWKKICGDIDPTFNNAVYLSEKANADRNFALAYFMREHGTFPEGVNIQETLEFYFQCCSIELTAEAMAIAAATLANGGICPQTGERVFESDTVKDCLSLMYSCGMYDFSGEFAFSIGLPAKSGVGGGLMIVVPNLLGICIWSPPLDKHGNSVRGIEFSKKLVESFNFHNYDSMVFNNKKIDPRNPKNTQKIKGIMSLCWAASQGDLNGVQRLVAQGVEINDADYDGRTPMHLAASEGKIDVIKYFLYHGAKINPIDRWGGTPLEDAKRENNKEVIDLFKAHKKENKRSGKFS